MQKAKNCWNRFSSTQYDNIKLYDAYGTNKISLIYEKTDKYQYEDYRAMNSFYCTINKKLIDIYFEKNIDKIFPNYFLKTYFETGPSMSWLNNNDDIIIYPNLNFSFIEHTLINNIKRNIISNSEVTLYDFIFDGLIKCDDYDSLKIMYNGKEENYDKIKMALLKSNFINIYYIDQSNYTKLRNSYKSIIRLFTEKYGVPKEDIIIDIQLFDITVRKWMWLNLNIRFRHIYKGEYEINRTSKAINKINLKELLKLMKLNKNKTMAELLGNKYSATLRVNFIEDLGIDSTHCNNVIANKVYPKFRLRKIFYSDPTDNHINSDIIDKNGKLAKFEIIRILSTKNTKLSTVCPIVLL